MNIESHNTCNFDKLMIYDGLDDNAALIGIYCDETPSSNIDYTTNNMAYIVFTSDGSVSGLGFKITYTAVDPEDGQYENGEQGSTGAESVNRGKTSLRVLALTFHAFELVNQDYDIIFYRKNRLRRKQARRN